MSTPQLPLKIASSRWPRGSEWRRWDLHVHTPESRVGSPFGGLTWEQYVTALETAATEAQISVVGVTDYMTLDGYEKLFADEHIELTYKIHYSGTELEYLSPGTRGIALLVLYLLMDEDDTRPLLIDQPEGNLDNSSVYMQMVPYIRKAKKRAKLS